MLYGIALHGISRFGCQSGVQTIVKCLLCPWIGAENRPIHAHVQTVYLVAEFVADVHLIAASHVGIPAHKTNQLPYFFLKRHAREQILGAY